MEPRTVRIFISSPGDVAEERRKAEQVIANLGKRYAGRMVLRPVLWENLALGADLPFQQGIERILHDQGGIDIAVFILWSRLGSPLGNAILRPDGSPFRSGTEREWELMLAARAESAAQSAPQDARPAILAYLRDDDRGFKQWIQDLPADDLEEAFRQRKLAETFVREQFHDAATGTNLRAYVPYDEPLTFAGRLRVHLQDLLDRMLPEAGRRAWDRAPYQGLEAFDVEHAAIFYGRQREICQLEEQFRARAKAGCPFVLLVGASGSGKSSLARAGLLHRLLHENEELDPSVRCWRPIVFTPAQSRGDLVGLLAQRLADVLPELRDDDGLEALVRALRQSPEQAWDLSLRRAVRKLDAEGRARLVLVVDQLEEVFTHPAITPDEVDRFLKAAGTLARRGGMWCLATVRSDFYDRCQNVPALMELKGTDGQMDLVAPDAAALEQIITRPAWLAGLRFEGNSAGETLDQRILAEAIAHPEALPLLQYLLRELYEARSGDGLLTYSQFTRLGGIEGALARRADDVFNALPQSAQDALTQVFRQLVSVGERDTDRPTRKPAALDAFGAADVPGRQLVEAFIAARLLTAREGARQGPHDAGKPVAGTSGAVVEVTHESLLSCWPPLVRWLEQDRELLRVRGRVGAAAARWHQEGRRGDRLLQTGKPLEEARQLVASGFELNPLETDYIAASQAQARGRRLVARLAIAALVVLAAAASVAAAVAGREMFVAMAATQQAQTAEANIAAEKTKVDRTNSQLADALAREQKTNAELDRQQAALAAEKKNVQRQLAQSLLDRGLNEVQHGDRNQGIAILGQAYRAAADAKEADLRRNVTTILGAWGIPSQRRLVHAFPVRTLAFSPDGRTLVTGGGSIPAPALPATPAPAPRAAPAPSSVPVPPPPSARSAPVASPARVTFVSTVASLEAPVANYSAARLWDCATGQPLGASMLHNQPVSIVAFSPAGDKIATADDRTIRLWDATTGHALGKPIVADGNVATLCFPPAGTRITAITWSGVLQTYDILSERWFGSRTKVSRGTPTLLVSADGTRAAIINSTGGGFFSFDDWGEIEVRVWDLAKGEFLGPSISYQGGAKGMALSPDGAKIAAAFYLRGLPTSEVRLWDATTGQAWGRPLPFESVVRAVAFSPNGCVLATGGNDHMVRLWDVASHTPLGDPMAHPGEVFRLAFSPDGSRIASACYTGFNLFGGGPCEVRLWDVATRSPLATLQKHERGLSALAFSPDGSRLATASEDGTVGLWDATVGPLGQPLMHDGAALAAAFHPNGKQLATSTADPSGIRGGVQFWDTATGLATGRPLTVDHMSVEAVFSPDGTRLLAASSDAHEGKGELQLWDLTTLHPLASPITYNGTIVAAAFSPDGTRIAVAGGDSLARRGDARLWDAIHGRPLGAPMQHAGMVIAIAFSRKGGILATAGSDHVARVWDASTGQPLTAAMQHDCDLQALAFSPDGTRLATAGARELGKPGEARLWDTTTGQMLGAPLRHDGAVDALAFSPDGKLLATASADRTARLWDVVTGKPVGESLKHGWGLLDVAFSPNGATLATVGEGNAIRLWDVSTGKPLGEILEPGGGLVGDFTEMTVAFSPDGTQLATTSMDHAAWLWPVPRPMPDDVRWLTAYADAASGWKEGPDAQLHPLTDAQAAAAARELDASPAWLQQRRRDADWLVHAWHASEARRLALIKSWGPAAFHLRWLGAHDPHDAGAPTYLGRAAAEQAQWDTAQEAYATAVRLAKDDIPLRCEAALAASAAKDAAGFQRQISDLVRAAQESARADDWSAAVQCAMLVPQTDSAVLTNLAKKAVQTNDSYEGYREAYGAALYRAGDLAQAIDTLNAAVKLRAARNAVRQPPLTPPSAAPAEVPAATPEPPLPASAAAPAAPAPRPRSSDTWPPPAPPAPRVVPAPTPPAPVLPPPPKPQGVAEAPPAAPGPKEVLPWPFAAPPAPAPAAPKPKKDSGPSLPPPPRATHAAPHGDDVFANQRSSIVAFHLAAWQPPPAGADPAVRAPAAGPPAPVNAMPRPEQASYFCHAFLALSYLAAGRTAEAGQQRLFLQSIALAQPPVDWQQRELRRLLNAEIDTAFDRAHQPAMP